MKKLGLILFGLTVSCRPNGAPHYSPAATAAPEKLELDGPKVMQDLSDAQRIENSQLSRQNRELQQDISRLEEGLEPLLLHPPLPPRDPREIGSRLDASLQKMCAALIADEKRIEEYNRRHPEHQYANISDVRLELCGGK